MAEQVHDSLLIPAAPLPDADTTAALHSGDLTAAAAADAPPTVSALPEAHGLGVGPARFSCVPTCECLNQPDRWSHCLECPRQTCDFGPCSEEGWGYSDARDGWLCPEHAPAAARHACHVCGQEGAEEGDGCSTAAAGEAAGEWRCDGCTPRCAACQGSLGALVGGLCPACTPLERRVCDMCGLEGSELRSAADYCDAAGEWHLEMYCDACFRATRPRA